MIKSLRMAFPCNKKDAEAVTNDDKKQSGR